METDGDEMKDEWGEDSLDGILKFVESLRALGVSNFEGKGIKLSLTPEPGTVSGPASNKEEDYDSLLYSDPEAYYQKQIDDLPAAKGAPKDADKT